MKIVIIIAAILLLVGCGSTVMSQQEVAIIQAQMQQQTLMIDCPAGCSVSYKDPRDKVVIPQRTNGWDAAIALAGSAERLASGAIVPWAFTEVAKGGFRALKGSGETHTTTTTVGDYSGTNSGRVGDYSGPLSGNSGRVNSPDWHSDSTHPPTVVEQPAPVIVEQPAPIVVGGGD